MDDSAWLIGRILDAFAAMVDAELASGDVHVNRALALLGDLEREWAAQIIQEGKDRQDHSPEAEARNDAMSARRDALMAAAEALPAGSREARHAKALALAWDYSIEHWRAGWTRDQYGADGRLMIDLMAGLTSELPNAADTKTSSLDQPKAAPVRVDTYDHATGRVTYADAAGTLREGSTADWLAFMAARLHRVARNEFSRRFDAESAGLNEAARDALDARLHRELRLDALFALAHRSDQVFAEAQAERDGCDPATLSADRVNLKALDVLQLTQLHEAFQAARYVWEGARERRFSISASDPRGYVHLSKVGELTDFEEDRAGRIVDRIVDEMASRTPRTEEERDRSLVLRLRHELDCEDRIRSDDLMREITQAWGA